MIKVRASQIFTHSMEDVVAAKKLLDSGTSFEEAVEKYSTCPSKKKWGRFRMDAGRKSSVHYGTRYF